MKITVMIFWVMTLCRDIVGYQHFRGPCSPSILRKITTQCHNPEDHNTSKWWTTWYSIYLFIYLFTYWYKAKNLLLHLLTQQVLNKNTKLWNTLILCWYCHTYVHIPLFLNRLPKNKQQRVLTPFHKIVDCLKRLNLDIQSQWWFLRADLLSSKQ